MRLEVAPNQPRIKHRSALIDSDQLDGNDICGLTFAVVVDNHVEVVIHERGDDSCLNGIRLLSVLPATGS